MKYGKILAAVLIGSTLLIGCSNDKNNDTNNGNNSNPPSTEQSQNPGNSTGTEKPDIITSRILAKPKSWKFNRCRKT